MATPLYLVELTAKVWPQIMRSGAPAALGSQVIGKTQVAVDSTLTYRLTANVRRSATADGRLYVGIALAAAPWGWIAANNVVANVAVTTYTATFGFGTANPLPGGISLASPALALNSNSTLGSMDCVEVWIEKTTAAGLAISADRYVSDANEWRVYLGTAPIFGVSLLSDVDAQTRILRYATAAYMTWASNTPALEQYDARVLNPGLLRAEIPAEMAGCIGTSYGEIVLNNADGALGALAYYGLDGQPFRVLRGRDTGSYGSFDVVLSGTMQQATVDRRQVRIRLAGRDAVLEQPVLRGRYLGNNVLPNGLEGDSTLAGQPKPMIYGAVYGIEPVCVNTARYIYHVGTSLGPATVPNVWDAGVALTGGALYTNQADMETNAPAAGQFRAWPAGGYFRLGSAPAGVVTCNADATETSYGSGNWWWKILYRLAEHAGLLSSEIQFAIGDAFAEPDNWGGASWPTDQAYCGLHITDAGTTIREAMNRICAGAGAWAGVVQWAGVPGGAAAKFGAEIFPPPGGTSMPVASFFNITADSATSIKGVADPGPGRGVPAYSVELTFAPLGMVITPSMAPSVSPLALGRLGIAKLRSVAADASVKVKHTHARAVVRDTGLSDIPAGVGFEAARLLALWRYSKLWLEVTLPLQAVLDASSNTRPRLGGYVYLTFPELQCQWQDGSWHNAGWFNVMVLEVNFGRSEVRLVLRQSTEQSI